MAIWDFWYENIASGNLAPKSGWDLPTFQSEEEAIKTAGEDVSAQYMH
jgi:hypothetical protein